MDTKHAYVYNNLIAHFEVCDEGVARFFRFLESRAVCKDENKEEVCAAIIAQSKATAKDYINFSRMALNVIDIIPKGRHELNGQSIKKIQDDCQNAIKVVEDWPNDYSRKSGSG
ncbi:hypothetical protein FJN13_14545 [Alteromonas mediterranea]|uniref:hypothetical protein n=1 Tax=Alteromonas mediterranea TaxID=314275 RepID=UPI0011301412|nr:hypothetical protein [Alteromonas mediterranea]QDG35953.1 hypothetical protein FJN13_14545 [Alteromonas mediterranea]